MPGSKYLPLFWTAAHRTYVMGLTAWGVLKVNRFVPGIEHRRYRHSVPLPNIADPPDHEYFIPWKRMVFWLHEQAFE